MTREEAIYILDNLKPTNAKSSFDAYVVGKAITMAIEALSAEPCEDAISRQAVDDAIYEYSRSCDVNYGQIMERIDNIPSVTPKRKDGKWVRGGWEDYYYMCNQCDYKASVYYQKPKFHYCPNCGAKMEESEESNG